METFVPRLIAAPEAKNLGIEKGWYGIKASGTIVTSVSTSREDCMEAISVLGKLPKL